MALGVVAALAVLGAGCSGGGDASGSPATTTAGVVPGSVYTAGGTSVVIEPPVTFVADASAQQVVDGLADRLPADDDVRACLVQRLGADRDLLGRVQQGVAPASPEFSRIGDLLLNCQAAVKLAPAFADGVNDAHDGALNDGQVRCLRDGYAALSPGDRDVLVSGGLDPKGSLASKAGATMTALLQACQVAS